MKVIITGATGMVGEGVMLTCLNHPSITEVLMVSRQPIDHSHPKIRNYIVEDFLQLSDSDPQLKGYDACFYCAGKSAVGLTENEYHQITYDTTMVFARAVLQNDHMVFNFVSGAHTDSTEKGKAMWARVKGKTENALMKLPFKSVFCFRPGLMKPYPEQQQFRGYNKYIKVLYPVMKLFFPACTIKEIGTAMINVVENKYSKNVLEVADIKAAANM